MRPAHSPSKEEGLEHTSNIRFLHENPVTQKMKTAPFFSTLNNYKG